MTNDTPKEDRIERFGPVARFTHWTHVVCFVILALTGFSLFWAWLSPLSAPFGGPYAAKWFHRWAGVAFIVLPLISLAVTRGRTSFQELASWDADDSRFLRAFFREFLGLSFVMPPQGRFNAGQKINALAVFVAGVVLLVTGLIMWFPDHFTLSLVRWSRPIHDLAACGLLAAVIGHFYLAVLHPKTKTTLQGMWKGTLPRSYLQENHSKWLETLRKRLPE